VENLKEGSIFAACVKLAQSTAKKEMQTTSFFIKEIIFN
jgi:hypothetical protein